MRALNFVFIVALVALATTTYGVGIKGRFVERRDAWAHGYLTGEFYYFYNESVPVGSRLRFDYTLKYLNGGSVSNLYFYEDGARYSMVGGNCSSGKIIELPDPWWLVDDLYEKSDEPTDDDGYAWYNRKTEPVNSTGQVKRIQMTEGSSSPADGYLRKIEFYDGRTLTFQDVVVADGLSQGDALFQPIESCPRPTCSVYADIVFVLDSSGSVSNSSWAKMVYFVNDLLSALTFEDERKGAAAAVVHFAGQDGGNPDSKDIPNNTFNHKVNLKNDPLCPNGKSPLRPTETQARYSADYIWPCTYKNHATGCPTKPKYMSRFGEILAGKDYGDGLTVSQNREYLSRKLIDSISPICIYSDGKPREVDEPDKCQNFEGPRGTCQAIGLQLAMDVLDRSPRKNYTNKPKNIVIVVTDGYDKFPNITRNNITLLQSDPYNALVIEVGVGIVCKYDKDYLTDVASVLPNGNKGYFDSEDFDAMASIVNDIFHPICYSNFSSECGPACNGFCGAGQCLCPDCDNSTNTCKFISCNVSVGFSKGCVEIETTKDNETCTGYYCDADAEGGIGKWIDVPEQCAEMKQKYNGTCRVVECDIKYGGCRPSVDESVCKKLEENSCEEWECVPPDGAVDPNDVIDTTTMCRMKKNYTKMCLDRIPPKASCFQVVCNETSNDCNDMIVDTCTSMNTKCYNYACTEVAGEYMCVGTQTSNVVNTSCDRWVCDPENEDGWVNTISRNEDYCKDKYALKNGQDSTKCKLFYCDTSFDESDFDVDDGASGCKFDVTCSDKCTEQNETDCRSQGTNDNSNCVYDFCQVIHDETQGDQGYKTVCASSEGKALVYNCLDASSPSAQEALRRNQANPMECYTPVCRDYQCTVEKVPLRDFGEETNLCRAPVCVKDAYGNWDWEMQDTKEKTTCVSDGCVIRECIGDQGCVPTENCTRYTDECYKYTCDNGVCRVQDLTVDFADFECMKEYCENGKKKTVYPDCVAPNACYEGTCVRGTCQYSLKKHEGNDICLTYTCDNATGLWSTTPNCDDDNYCTKDECWNYGTMYECRNIPIDCSVELTSEGFECFESYCKEYPSLSDYRCVRKLLPHRVLDICGNCISSGGDSVQSGSASLIDCTNAPPEPMYVETVAAATIALIIVAAVIAGSVVGTSSVVGTKVLIARARAASNQVAMSNPLFEGAETELTNPAFIG